MIHLVLSGGGARGSFQWGAVKAVLERHTIGRIYGVSVGALNGLMLAIDRANRLDDIWANITNDQVYRGKMNAWGVIRALMRKRNYVIDMAPAREMIEREAGNYPILVPLQVGVVNGITGEYKAEDVDQYNSTEVTYQSSAIAGIMPLSHWTGDGGFRNNSPLGDAIKLAKPGDQIIVVNCSSRRIGTSSPWNMNRLLKVAGRFLGIVLNENLRNDVGGFEAVNDIAKAHGNKITGASGRDYHYFPVTIIEPDGSLDWGMLDFDNSPRGVDIGYRRAKNILNGSTLTAIAETI